MLHRISTASTRRPWLVIGLWVALLVGGALVGQMKLYDVTTSDTGGFLPSSYESARATAFGETALRRRQGRNGRDGAREARRRAPAHPGRPGQGRDADRPDGRLAARLERDPATRSALTDDEQAARALKTVAGPTAGAGRFQLVGLQFRGNSTDPTVQKAFKQFRSSTVHAFAATASRSGSRAASPARPTTPTRHRATTQLEGVLLLRRHRAAQRWWSSAACSSTVVPLLTVVLVAGGANGAVVLAALAFGFHLDSSTPTLIETVLIGIGIDYFLFMTFRFRERLRAGESGREAAAANAARQVGPVVASAALAIVAAFATLGLARFGQFHVLGPSVAVAIVVMLLAGVTLVPALLAAQGRQDVLALAVMAAKPRGRPGRAARLARAPGARAASRSLASGAPLLAVAVFAIGGKMNYDLTTVPKDTRGRPRPDADRADPAEGRDRRAADLRSLVAAAHRG